MPTMNKVFLLGNLARDPDLRGLNDGNSVCEMRMAVSRKYKMNGREVEETCFVDVIIFGKNACNCKQFLTKGSQVLVEGRLQLDEWVSRDGDKRSKLVVIAEFLTVHYTGTHLSLGNETECLHTVDYIVE